MPGESNKDIQQEQKTCSEIRSGSGSDPTRKSLEFHAEVIPYDTCEDPNAPILAFSGDNMNLIFNIPKEKFLKLAVAVINHLEHQSNFEPPEKNSNGAKRPDNRKHNETKSRLSDVVKNLDGDNSNDIVRSYEEDSCESQNSKNKDDALSVDQKSFRDAHGNGAVELEESVSNGWKSGKPHQNTETKKFEESSNFKSTLAFFRKSLSKGEKHSEQECSDIVGNTNESYLQCGNNDSDNDSEMESGKNEEIEGIKSSRAEHADVEQEPNSEDCATENEVDIEDMNLSAHSLGISGEDCPELENAWPDIYPYEKTEEIPVKELKSLELKGLLTKYLKLELSNEFIVIKVTSGSSVLVDAVKYKEMVKEPISKTRNSGDSNLKDVSEEQSTQSVIGQVCTKPSTVGNKHADSVDEVKISRADESANCESTSIYAVISEETGAKIISETVGECPDTEPESFESGNETNAESDNLIPMNENPSDSIAQTVDAGPLKSPELDSKNQIASNIQGNGSDEAFELGSPNKILENSDAEKMISLKIEQKLEELDTNIPGASPTERLKFILNSSLKSPDSETEAKQMEVSVSTKHLPESEIKVSSLENANESISDCPEKCNETNSQDEFAAEFLDSSYSNKAMKPSCENKSECHVSSNAEKESPMCNSEHALSIENKPICASMDSFKSGLSDGEASEAGKLISTNCILKDEKSLNNTDVFLKETEKESMNLSSGDKDSFEDSALGNDLRVSETEILRNDSTLFENIECNEIDSSEKLNTPCKLEETKTVTDVGETIFSKDLDPLSNESPERVKDVCKKETIKSEKLITSEDLGCLAEETPQNNSVDDSDSVCETFKEKLNIDINACDRNENIKDMDKQDKKSEESKFEKTELVKVSDVSRCSSAEKSPEDKCESNAMKDVENGEADTESVLEESIADENDATLNETLNSMENPTNEPCGKHSKTKSLEKQNVEGTDLVSDTTDTEKLPENSFVSNTDSFMDSTVDNIESASEGGDFESDDVKSIASESDAKSIASESDDSKDSEIQFSKRKGALKKNSYQADEVDCAPTRVRTKRAISGLSEDVIPENSPSKNGKTSKVSSFLHASERITHAGRSLRSKSLDPTPQQSKGILHDKKHVIDDSNEVTRRTRAKTPDIVTKKDIKITARSSPRKLARAATTEPSSAQKVESAKTSVADSRSKPRGNLDSSISTSKRSKRGNKL